jgi:uncharacterized protein (DUF849 family)
LETNPGIDVDTFLRARVEDSDWKLPLDAVKLGQLYMLQHLASPAMQQRTLVLQTEFGITRGHTPSILDFCVKKTQGI